MGSREEIFKGINKPEDRMILAKVLDKAEFSTRAHKPAHTEFLDPHQQNLAEMVLASTDRYDYELYGGFPASERKMVLFYSEYEDEDERLAYAESVLKVIEIVPKARGSLTHRDYLGAVMALGIKREIIGDIVVEAEKCNLGVISEMAGYIASNLEKVGNTGVTVSILDIMDLAVPEPKTSEIKTTVAALRLDSICAPAFGISRSKAAECIKTGKVSLNWEMVMNPDKPVREGDTISMKGKGRAVLDHVGGRTRKDRLMVGIRKLV